MAKKTQEEIKQIVELYAELGVYSKVAKQLGMSASTVSKYVKENVLESNVFQSTGISFNKEIKSIDDIPFPTDWQNFLQLNEQEKVDMIDLQKEILK